MRILIATGNKGKLREMLEVLHDLPHEFLSLEDLPSLGFEQISVEEHGATHEANAELKARAYAKIVDFPVIGEDSGLWVDALHGELGVHTRRWGAGEHATDEEWLAHFFRHMESIPEEERGATFVSVAAYACRGVFGTACGSNCAGIHFFRGETHGRITGHQHAPLQEGIPISACFIPDGCDKVYSALSTKEKNAVSHRGKAMAQLKQFLGN